MHCEANSSAESILSDQEATILVAVAADNIHLCASSQLLLYFLRSLVFSTTDTVFGYRIGRNCLDVCGPSKDLCSYCRG